MQALQPEDWTPFKSSVVGTKAAASVQNSGTIQTRPKKPSAAMGSVFCQVFPCDVIVESISYLDY